MTTDSTRASIVRREPGRAIAICLWAISLRHCPQRLLRIDPRVLEHEFMEAVRRKHHEPGVEPAERQDLPLNLVHRLPLQRFEECLADRIPTLVEIADLGALSLIREQRRKRFPAEFHAAGFTFLLDVR